MEERAGLRIRVFGDPALRKRTSPVKAITEAHRNILSRMSELMYADAGVGLAAPQLGINEAMIVADIGAGLYKIINPKILKRSGSQVNQEGCLSLPGICVKVRRANSIAVEALDEEGKKIKIDAEGLFACVLQHEIDHLKAKLIIDYASFIEKLKIKNKLETLKQRSRHEPRPSLRAGAEERKVGRGEGLPEPKDKSCRLQL